MKRTNIFRAGIALLFAQVAGLTSNAQEAKVAYAGNYQSGFQGIVEKAYVFDGATTITEDHVLSGKMTMIQAKYVDTLLDPELGNEYTVNKVGLGFVSADGDTLPPLFTTINEWKIDRYLVSYDTGGDMSHFLVNGKGELVDYCDGGWNKYVYVKSGNYWGVLATEDAKEIVPVKYEMIASGHKLADGWELQDDNTAVSKTSAVGNVFCAMEGGKWGVVETFKGVILPFKYEKISEPMTDRTGDDFDMKDERPHTIFIVTVDGKQGLMNYAGEQLTPTIFDYVGWPNFTANAVLVKFGDQWGAVNTQGKKLLDCKFFDVDIMNGDVVTFAAKENTKWACYDSEGNEILPAKYDKIARYYPNSKTFAVKLNGKWGKVDAKGKVWIAFEYDQFDRDIFAE